MFKLDKGYSFEVDIWFVGVIMLKLLTGKYPFKIEQGKIGNFEFDFLNDDDIKISEASKDLIKQILVIKPLKRPKLSQILYHYFFHNCKL